MSPEVTSQLIYSHLLSFLVLPFLSYDFTIAAYCWCLQSNKLNFTDTNYINIYSHHHKEIIKQINSYKININTESLNELTKS